MTIKSALGVLTVLTVAGGLQACGSSGSASSTSSPAAATTAATTGASTSSGASLAAARARVKQAEAVPTKISVSTPLKSNPPTGKTFVWFNCDLSACTSIGSQIKLATAAVGWNYRQVSYQSENPATLVTAMKQALRLHPSYVGLTGLAPSSGWGTEIASYRAAGVKIIPSFLGNLSMNNTVIANVAGPTLANQTGKTLADWFATSSDGKGQALLQRVDDFPVLKIFADAFATQAKAVCPGCQVVNLNNTIPQATSGGIVPSVVSTLRSHSSLDYLVSSSAALVSGLPSALSAADLSSRVKFAAQDADAPALTALKSGQAAAMIGNPLDYAGWLTVDTALRDSEGMTFDRDPEIPIQLVLPSSTFKIADSFDVPPDFANQFKALWNVG